MLTFGLHRAHRWALGAFILTLGHATVFSQAQSSQIGGIGLTVFSDAEYHGRNATFRTDTPDLKPYGMDDRISSLRVGPGEMWEVCELPDYQGRCQVFSGATPSLGKSEWSDIISSVRRVRDDVPSTRPPASSVGLELFSGVRYQGERRLVTNEIPDLRQIGFERRASSIRLGRMQAWEVCVDTDYRGCRVVDADWPDLSRLQMARRISSVRPWYQDGGNRPPVPGAGGRITLFDDRHFKGKAVVVDSPRATLNGFQDKAESVRVMSGVWELCERSDFSGRCAIVSTDVSDLSALGLRNRVTSARPRP